jgi:hypothetical protein
MYIVENPKHTFIFNDAFPKIVPFMRYCGKYDGTRKATVDNIIGRTRFACWITKATRKHLHAQSPRLSEYVILYLFLFHGKDGLRYTNIACLLPFWSFNKNFVFTSFFAMCNRWHSRSVCYCLVSFEVSVLSVETRDCPMKETNWLGSGELRRVKLDTLTWLRRGKVGFWRVKETGMLLVDNTVISDDGKTLLTYNELGRDCIQ